MKLSERFFLQFTSGRFIFTVVVAGVYAYLACNGLLATDKIMEITLIVLYAYFTKQRPDLNGNGNGNGNGESEVTTTTTTLPPVK